MMVPRLPCVRRLDGFDTPRSIAPSNANGPSIESPQSLGDLHRLRKRQCQSENAAGTEDGCRRAEQPK